jgi:hypothetical protein
VVEFDPQPEPPKVEVQINAEQKYASRRRGHSPAFASKPLAENAPASRRARRRGLRRG